MNIGLLTFHDTNNFGSYLQTFGLYKKVGELGYDCEIIDYQCRSIINREQFGTYKVSLYPKDILIELLINRILRRKYKHLKDWLISNAKLSDKYDKLTIKNAEDKYDKILVGSDMVWGLDITEKDTTYFLDFITLSKKKIAFASSIGNPWNMEEKKVLTPLLRDFACIAVREEESADWVEELTNVRPSVVCDPTMLLPAEQWAEYKSDKYASERYILVYFPTKDNVRDAKQYAATYHLKCYVINYGLPIKGCKSVKPTTIADFLSLFYYASFVFTGSYHGLLFSIYFNREFAYYNRAHKSRMNTLAHKFGLQEREGTEYDALQMQKINYTKVNLVVESYRNAGVKCLDEMLKK